jgi:hypothetical protein
MQLRKSGLGLKSNPAKVMLTLALVALGALVILRVSTDPVEAASPAPQGTPQLVWEGRLISDIGGLTSGGTIIQVSVIGVEGLPIEVSSAHGGWSATKLSGSKPELGPYAAEFAGLSPGRYIVAPQGVGVTVTVEADGTDIIVVEFVQVLIHTTPTPVVHAPVSEWEARILSVQQDLSLAGSVLRVSVVGEIGLLVEISTPEGWSATGYTGTKPEYGDYMVEFAALQRGTYIIRPQGVDTEFSVSLDGRSYVYVEFRRREGYTPPPSPTPTTRAPTATPTRRPATPTPTPTTRPAAATPAPTTPTAPPTATGTPAPAPSPVPTPVTVWSGRVVSNTSGEQYAGYLSTVQVIVEGLRGLPVEIRSGGWNATALTGSKPECGDTCLEFGGLSPSLYTIIPQGLGASVDVVVQEGGLALIEFTSQLIMPATATPTPTPNGPTLTPTPTLVATPVPSPSAPTPTPAPQKVWAARLLYNTGGSEPTGGFFSAIQVSVIGLKGLPVEIRSGGWSATALTGTKPECGEFCLEFGGLSGSTYTIIPQGLGITYVVTVDGVGFAAVEFYQTSAQVGPEVWTGRVVENISGGGTRGYFAAIQVIVEGKKWLPVEIGAGDWRDSALTGTKPECGEFCLEFGGLSPGTYVVTPQGLGPSVAVTVDEGGLARVEFARTQ